MHYVYVLRRKSNRELYYGYTSNLEKRIADHNKDKEWDLIYYEAYLIEKDARTREMRLKDYGQSRSHLKKRICNSLSI